MEDAGFLQTAVTGWSSEGWPRRPSPWARRCRHRRCPSCRSSRRRLGLPAPAGALVSSSTLPDAPPCIWVLPCAPPRTCVSDEAPCASTGPASRAEIATAIAEVFTSFIQFSQVLVGDERSVTSAPFGTEHARRRITHVANGALAMQAARCGDRAGISGSFCESLAMDRPHMRRRELSHLRSEDREPGLKRAAAFVLS